MDADAGTEPTPGLTFGIVALLRQVMADSRRDLGLLAASGETSLTSAESADPMIVNAERHQIERAVSNLVENAET